MTRRVKAKSAYDETNLQSLLAEADEVDHTNETEIMSIGNGSKIQTVDINLLKNFPGNRDIADSDLDDFAANIKRNGFHGTIAVIRELDTDPTASDQEFDESKKALARSGEWTGKYIIISGHRRVAAVRKIMERNPDFLDGGRIPAVILKDDISWNEVEELNILYNDDAKDLSQKEKKAAIARLSELYKKRGLPDAAQKVAQKLKMSTATVYNYLKIDNELIPELLEKFDHDEIDFRTAVELSKSSEEVQKQIETKLQSGQNLTKDDVINERDKVVSEDKELRDKVAHYEKVNEQLTAEIEKLREKRDQTDEGSEERENLNGEIQRLSKRRSKANAQKTKLSEEFPKKQENKLTKAAQKIGNDVYLLQTKIEAGAKLSDVDKGTLTVAVKRLLAIVPDAVKTN